MKRCVLGGIFNAESNANNHFFLSSLVRSQFLTFHLQNVAELSFKVGICKLLEFTLLTFDFFALLKRGTLLRLVTSTLSAVSGGT